MKRHPHFLVLIYLFLGNVMFSQNAPTGFTLSLQENGQSLTNHVITSNEFTARATVSLQGGTFTTDTVVPITVAGSGIAGVLPFTADGFSITITAGETSGSADFSVKTPSSNSNNVIAYGDETIMLTATLPVTSPAISLPSASTSFKLTDNVDVSLTIISSGEEITEGDTGIGDVSIRVRIEVVTRGQEGSDGRVKQPFLVDYSISGDVTDEDITTRTGTLTVPVLPDSNTRRSHTLTLPAVVGDILDEDDERFTITFRNPRLTSTGATLDGDSVSVTIIDDDTTQVQIADTSVDEADSVTFTITLDPLNAFPLTVNYATSDDTATASSDYTDTSESVTIPAMSETATFSVPVIDDVLVEAAEQFTVTLTSTDRGQLGTATTATATIIDNDPPPTSVILSVDRAEVIENTTVNITVTATLDNAPSVFGSGTLVQVMVSAGDVTTASDFVAVDDFDITIPAKTRSVTGIFELTLNNNNLLQPNLVKTLSVAGTSTLTVIPASITITDDDTLPVPSVCMRTPQVRDAIVAEIDDVSDCNQISVAHLETIITLNLANKMIIRLKDSDFSGLSALTSLNLRGNEFTTLPTGIFSDLPETTVPVLDTNVIVTPPADAFVTTWETTGENETITIPTTGSGYNYNVDCNADERIDFRGQTDSATCTYKTAGTHTVVITGTFPRIYFNNERDKDKIIAINQWGTGQWTSMNNAFYGANNLVGLATDRPDLSMVTDMSQMFLNATKFNQDIGDWDVGEVKNMVAMLSGATTFNQDIGGWDVGEVKNMSGMFLGATKFNQDIGDWDVSGVTDMSFMFSGAGMFNGDISGWKVGNVTTMLGMFTGAKKFNRDISNWTMSNVTSMQNMFSNAAAFNQDIGDWDVSGVTNMSSMFSGAGMFNGDIGGWNVSKAVNMREMFSGTTAFSQNLGRWYITPEVLSVAEGVAAGTEFGTLSAQNSFLNSQNPSYMLTGTDASLFTLSGSTIRINSPPPAVVSEQSYQVTVTASGDFGTANSRDITIKVIRSPSAFITTWRTTRAGETITIPTIGSGYNYNVDCDGDSNIDLTNQSGSATCTYETAGIHTVVITGTFPRIYFDSNAERRKILSVTQWGTGVWTSMENAFSRAGNLDITATDVPNLSAVTSMKGMFRFARGFTGKNTDMNRWDVSNVTNMQSMFRDASAFNQNIGDWDVSSVINMRDMLFNTPLSSANYDALLIGWSTISAGESPLQRNVDFRGTTAKYCVGGVSKSILIGSPNNWDVSDGGQASPAEGCSDDGTLSELIISAGALSPVFAANTFNYEILSSDNPITLTPTVNNPLATVTVNGVAVTSGASSGEIGISEEGSIRLVVTAHNLSTQTHRIDIVDNRVPTDISLSSTTVDENVAIGTTIATLSATELDDDTLTYTLVSGEGDADNDDFTISENSLVINVSPDFETTTTPYSIRIKVTDDATDNAHDFFKSFTISVNDVNETPTRIELSSTEVDENVTDGTTVGTLSTIDPDDSNTFTYALVSGDVDNDDFTISENSLVINVSPDFEVKPSYAVIISVNDGLNDFAEQFTITINDLQAPQIRTSVGRLNSGANTPITPITIISSGGIITLPYRIIPAIINGLVFDTETGTISGTPTVIGDPVKYTITASGTEGSGTATVFIGVSADPNSFITTWRTTRDNESITIPVFDPSINEHDSDGPSPDLPLLIYNYTVDWGDGSSSRGRDNNNISHEYAKAGDYKVSISGTFLRIYFNGYHTPNRNANYLKQIVAINQWGTGQWDSMRAAFAGAINLVGLAIDSPDLSQVTDMDAMFARTSFNQDISDWDVSSVTDMQSMFLDASAFNQNIGDWDVSSVTNMRDMFSDVTAFNQNIGNWDVSSVTNMQNMLLNTPLSSANYDALLIGWSTISDDESPLQRNVKFSGTTKYCVGGAARDILTGSPNNWVVSDGGQASPAEGCSNDGTLSELTVSAGTLSPVFATNIFNYEILNSENSITLTPTVNNPLATVTVNGDSVPSGASSGEISISEGDSINLVVTAHNQSTQTYTITVVSNRVPTDISLSSTTVDENIAIGTTIATLSATELDGDMLTYTLVSGEGDADNDDFTILEDKLSINVLSDFETTTTSYSIRIKVTDDATDNTHDFFKSFTISVNDVNEAPTEIELSSTEVDENVADGTTVGTLSTIDPDRDNTFTYTVIAEVGDTENRDFAILGDKLITKASPDFEAKSSYVIRISVNDGLNDFAEQFTITINDLQLQISTSVSRLDIPSGTRITPITIISSGGIITPPYRISPAIGNGLVFDTETGTISGTPIVAAPTIEYTITANSADGNDTATVSITVSDHTRFVTTWQTTLADETITIPTTGGDAYNYTVNWGDGTIDSGQTGDASHQYAVAGTYIVSISGTFPRIYFNGNADSKDKIITINQWGTGLWASMENAFYGANNLDITATDAPVLSSVTNTAGMFRDATSFTGMNTDINRWDMSNVTDMRSMFNNAAFNQNIGDWDVSSVANMQNMLLNAPLSLANYDALIIGWATISADESPLQQNVQFSGTTAKYCIGGVARNILTGSPNNWIVSDGEQANSAEGCSDDAILSNLTISAGTLSPVFAANTFNYEILSSDNPITLTPTVNPRATVTVNGVAVTSAARSGDISISEGSSITLVVTAQNQSTHSYTISVVSNRMPTNIRLSSTTINEKATAGVTIATISATDIDGDMLTYALVSGDGDTDNAAFTLPDTRLIIASSDFGTKSSYSIRIRISDGYNNVDKVFTITTLSNPSSFITTWRTTADGERIHIPTKSDNDENGGTYNYNYTVDWGDGSSNSGQRRNVNHKYALAGDYIVSISGDFPVIYFNNDGDKEKIIAINQWGTGQWNFMEGAFYGAINLKGLATDSPDLSEVNSIKNMFRNARVFNQNIGDWDVSSVTNMESTFEKARKFNQNIGDWNVSRVTNMQSMLTQTDSLSWANYDALLIGWATISDGEFLQQNVDLGMANKYCAGGTAKSILTGSPNNWVVSDKGQASPAEGCSNDGTLSELIISAGTLSPVFAANTFDYEILISDKPITLTPTANHPLATITVNEASVTSGNISGEIDISEEGSITLVVTAHNQSTQIYRIDIVDNRDPTGSPTITGTAIEGLTLTADTSDINEPDGLGEFRYQWLAGGNNIVDNANEQRFVLTRAQVGLTITVRVSYTDKGGFNEALISAATDTVMEMLSVLIPNPRYTITEGTEGTFDLATVFSNAVSYSAQGQVPSFVTLNGSVLTFAPRFFVSEYTRTFQVSAYDDDSRTVSADFTLTVTDVKSLSVQGGNIGVLEGKTVKRSIIHQYDVAPTGYTLTLADGSDKPDWISISNDFVIVSPPYNVVEATNHKNFEFRISSIGKTPEASIEFTVTVVDNSATPITYDGELDSPKAIDEDDKINYNILEHYTSSLSSHSNYIRLSYDDDDGATSFPDWFSFSHDSIRVAPGNSEVGTQRIPFKVTDAIGNYLTGTLVLTVRNVNDAPTTLSKRLVVRLLKDMKCKGGLQNNAEKTFDLSTVFSDVDVDDVLTYSIIPDGIMVRGVKTLKPNFVIGLSELNNNLLNFNFMPNVDYRGFYHLGIKATDEDMESITNVITLQVGSYSAHSEGSGFIVMTSCPAVTASSSPVRKSKFMSKSISKSVILGGSAISTEGERIRERGIIYSTSASDENSLIIGGQGVSDTEVMTNSIGNSFSKGIIGLATGITHYYRAYITDDNGITAYGGVKEFTLETDADSTLENKDIEKIGFTISPNPTDGIINITAAEKADYRLFNIRGQTLKTGVLNTGENKINLSSFAKGIYFLNIKTNKGSFTEKVVRN